MSSSSPLSGPTRWRGPAPLDLDRDRAARGADARIDDRAHDAGSEVAARRAPAGPRRRRRRRARCRGRGRSTRTSGATRASDGVQDADELVVEPEVGREERSRRGHRPSWRDRSVALATASRNADRTARASSARSPAAVVPPGDVTWARSDSGVCPVAASSAPAPSKRPDDQRRRGLAGEPLQHARLDERLDDEVEVRGHRPRETRRPRRAGAPAAARPRRARRARPLPSRGPTPSRGCLRRWPPRPCGRGRACWASRGPRRPGLAAPPRSRFVESPATIESTRRTPAAPKQASRPFRGLGLHREDGTSLVVHVVEADRVGDGARRGAARQAPHVGSRRSRRCRDQRARTTTRQGDPRRSRRRSDLHPRRSTETASANATRRPPRTSGSCKGRPQVVRRRRYCAGKPRVITVG